MMHLFTLSRWPRSLPVFWMAMVISVMLASFQLLAQPIASVRVVVFDKGLFWDVLRPSARGWRIQVFTSSIVLVLVLVLDSLDRLASASPLILRLALHAP